MLPFEDGEHIAKSNSLASSLFLHLHCLSFHSFPALYTPIFDFCIHIMFPLLILWHDVTVILC